MPDTVEVCDIMSLDVECAFQVLARTAIYPILCTSDALERTAIYPILHLRAQGIPRCRSDGRASLARLSLAARALISGSRNGATT